MTKAYSIATQDRTGAQINEELFVYAHCDKNNIEYIGSVGETWFAAHYKMSNFLNLPLPVRKQTNAYSNYLKISENDYSREIYPNVNNLIDSIFIEKIRSKFFNQHKKNNSTDLIVAIHIRRGDITPENTRYIPDKYYIDIIDKIKDVSPLCKISIYSDSNDFEKIDDFLNRGCILKINIDLQQTWKELIFSDILVMSKSSFSYVPAIYNSGFIIYYPAWYQKLDHWTCCTDSNLWEKFKLFLTSKM